MRPELNPGPYYAQSRPDGLNLLRVQEHGDWHLFWRIRGKNHPRENYSDGGLGLGGHGLELGLGSRVSVEIWDSCFLAWLWLLYTTFMGSHLGSLINEGYLGIG